jgi:tripartite-type tricarboxylate transporter receptor subunit TctC
MPNAIPQASAGKVNALGITVAKRQPQMSDVPTIAEAGVNGFRYDTWFGLLAPAATPRPVVDRLNAEMLKVLADPAVRDTLTGGSQEIVGSSPSEFAAVVVRDLKVWTDLATKLNVKVD